MKGKSETLCCTHDAGWCRLGGANVWVTRVTALPFSDHIKTPSLPPAPARPAHTNWFHHHVSQSEKSEKDDNKSIETVECGSVL